MGTGPRRTIPGIGGERSRPYSKETGSLTLNDFRVQQKNGWDTHPVVSSDRRNGQAVHERFVEAAALDSGKEAIEHPGAGCLPVRLRRPWQPVGVCLGSQE